MNTHNRTFLLILCILAALVAAGIAALMGEPAEKWLGLASVPEWQTQAEAEHADWMDEMNTRESVRPI